VGTVTPAKLVALTVYYRPDDSPEWLLWKKFDPERFGIIGKSGALGKGGLPTARPGFAPRVPLGKPPDRCDPVTARNLRRGFFFQVLFIGAGHVVLDRFRLHGMKLVEKSTATC
jgi:hypothetical protein